MEVRLCYKTARYDESRAFYEVVLQWPIFKEFDGGVVYKIEGSLFEILNSSADEATKFDETLYLYIETKDLNALYKTLEKFSPAEIRSFEWGHRSFTIKDPAGFTLKFFSQNL